MKTKLVYVLTCAPEATYIEQALISIWSARYHNPDAHIVLLVDDKTNELLVGKRAEVLEYVTEKIVILFADSTASMMYRSRYIKTQVRELIQGEFLFIDCDTIVLRTLSDIDQYSCEVGAVLESHLRIDEYCSELYISTKKLTSIIDFNLDLEQEYFSSGVLFVRDTEATHRLYQLWHKYWLDGVRKDLKIDQPSLAKANRDINHIIQKIPDAYNCILFTHPPCAREAYILHIAAYNNPCFVFSPIFLNFIKNEGLKNVWVKQVVLNPFTAMMPFNYNLRKASIREIFLWIKELSFGWAGYKEYIDKTFIEFPDNNIRMHAIVKYLLCHDFIRLALTVYLTEKYLRTLRKNVKYNVCQK